ncbi:uncharacterized protein LOC130053051 [Ostrea edulis]|uniref:uncharacterized protein LOC130053051 n=1 Tax=Ostrea edulis TaxID=37623 RepID=UPI002095B2BE|nr:uncharacterized protein LOC125649240 isoform X1 [Ostrea edulis]XP_056015566.1 uncharacterized protein LOC130053051 [Ostrea edulis]
MHWILSKEPEVEAPPVPTVEDLITCQEYLEAKEPLPWLRQQLAVSPDKVIHTAFLTTGQRENAVWAAVRKLRFTASNFGQIIAATKRNRLTNSLKKRLLSAYNLEKRASIQWGINHESVAIAEYCKAGDVTVVQTGIWLHESGVLGASPDGFVQGYPKLQKFHLQGKVAGCISPDIIEVKCPFSAKGMAIKDACANLKAFYLECNSAGTLNLKERHDYWHQIQGQLYLTGTTCCDFVVWTPVDMAVIRILRDELWQSNLTNMIEFYFNDFLPSV